LIFGFQAPLQALFIFHFCRHKIPWQFLSLHFKKPNLRLLYFFVGFEQLLRELVLFGVELMNLLRLGLKNIFILGKLFVLLRDLLLKPLNFSFGEHFIIASEGEVLI
jgi:hypothetical protein